MFKKKVFITFIVIIFSIQMFGQAVPPPIPPPPPPGLPIDGGVMYLLLGGLIFGIKKINDKS
jgi:hypothetical protein